MNRSSLEELVKLAERESRFLSDLIKERESLETGLSIAEITQTMGQMYDIMLDNYRQGVESDKRSVSGLTGGEGWRLKNQIKGRPHGGIYAKAAAHAMGISNINASMGRIVAAPTAGSCGIIPGSVITLAMEYGKTREEVVNSLFTAACIGRIIAENASLSGAEGGCQAECGSAAAMAAGAGVELCGGTPRQVSNAVAFALKAVMGLVCDPVAGLVESPCIKRNGFGAVQALLAMDMALAGIDSVIPADEVISAMDEVSRAMPVSMKETAEGGVAAAPTGKRIADYLMNSGAYCHN
ncbi:MAG: L-serine ammonia-lyase, iron-sulfur-dependent, subunit alpha [Caldicoprobacterales bacterium]|jgi:L-serine dehydratase|nr:L-serine ammonia-lyase, iron-sulfur-dependent, subunit alpha [Clostridiales bacterium]